MEGIEVLREIKANPATQDVKVFIMTNAEAELQRLDSIQPDKLIIKANTPPTELVKILKEELG
jgi:CheY-like chemotaxis protein